MTGSCTTAQPARFDSAIRSCSQLSPPGRSTIVRAITPAWSTDTAPAASAAAVAGIDRAPAADATLAAKSTGPSAGSPTRSLFANSNPHLRLPLP